MWLTISSFLLPMVLLWLVANRQLVRQNVRLKRETLSLMQEMIELSEDHTRVFREMISRVHHQGLVPISASALGLMYVISLELSKCIISLEKLQSARDWKTYTVSSELLRIMSEEMHLLELKLRELNTEIKHVTNEYSNRQYYGHPDNDIEPQRNDITLP